MEKLIIREDKGYLFAEISEDIFKKLNEITFDRCIIHMEQISLVHNILGISDDNNKEYIRAIRNSIVRYYSDMARRYYNNEVQDFENLEKYNIKMIAITCAIDIILEA